MSTVSHPQSTSASEESGWLIQLRIAEMWASLAIFAMWIAVAVASVWGPNAVFQSNDGNGSTIPTGVFVAVFAAIGTWAVAKYAFRSKEER